MEPGDMLGGLLRNLRPKREIHEDYNLKTIGTLTESELREYRIIESNGDILNKEFSKLMTRRKELEARNTLFWSGVRRTHNCVDNEFLHLEDVADGNVEIQSGTKKEELDSPNPFSGLFGN